MTKNNILSNKKIPNKPVRLIDESGNMLGIMSRDEALLIAKNRSLDLIIKSLSADPMVCIIGDVNKFIFQQNKQKKKPKKQITKQISVGPNIGVHDLTRLVKDGIKFLVDGMQVSYNIKLRRRVKKRENRPAVLIRCNKVFNEIVRVIKELGIGKSDCVKYVSNEQLLGMVHFVPLKVTLDIDTIDFKMVI